VREVRVEKTVDQATVADSIPLFWLRGAAKKNPKIALTHDPLGQILWNAERERQG